MVHKFFKKSKMPTKSKLLLITIILLLLGSGGFFLYHEKNTTPQNPQSAESEMILIPAGTFIMNADDSVNNKKNGHAVEIEKAFYMSKYEVTTTEYFACVHAGACSPPEWFSTTNPDKLYYYKTAGVFEKQEKQPVVGVSWTDAMNYTRWLSNKTGKIYRLPTEAEWEYAARAGSTTPYWWGNEIIKNKANCGSECGDKYKAIAPVGTFGANPFGLYDTAGNVKEWTCSDYSDNYDSNALICSEDNSKNKVLRGGAWFDAVNDLRTSKRSYSDTSFRSNSIGFRVVSLF